MVASTAESAVRTARVMALALSEELPKVGADRDDPEFPHEISTFPVRFPDRRDPAYVEAVLTACRPKLQRLPAKERAVMEESSPGTALPCGLKVPVRAPCKE